MFGDNCWDCSVEFDPENYGIARDGQSRCPDCHAERVKLQDAYRRALQRSERCLKASAFVDSFRDSEVL